MKDHIEQEFNSMMGAAGLDKCCAVQRREMRRAFYAGSVATLAMLAGGVEKESLLREQSEFLARIVPHRHN